MLTLRPEGESHVSFFPCRWTRGGKGKGKGKEYSILVSNGREDLLDTVRVEVGLIDAHGGERGGMIVVFVLFGGQLAGVVTCKWSGGFRSTRKRELRRFWGRHGRCFCMSGMCSALGISSQRLPLLHNERGMCGRIRASVPSWLRLVPGLGPTYPELTKQVSLSRRSIG